MRQAYLVTDSPLSQAPIHVHCASTAPVEKGGSLIVFRLCSCWCCVKEWLFCRIWSVNPLEKNCKENLSFEFTCYFFAHICNIELGGGSYVAVAVNVENKYFCIQNK